MKIQTAFSLLLGLVGCWAACHNPQPSVPPPVVTDFYELHRPAGKARAVLVLFGGYGEQASDIQQEFKVLAPARERGVAVLLLNFSQRLWLEDEEREQLAQNVQKALTDNQLPLEHVFFGGFSSGGNVALVLANYLATPRPGLLQTRGVFSVDAPIDLTERYRAAADNLNKTAFPSTAGESAFLFKLLGDRFGDPAQHLPDYERYAVCTLQSGHLGNVSALKNTPLHLYTEPDSTWWQQERGVAFEQTNAHLIRRLCGLLTQAGFNQAECLETRNRGYRANGQRHPHSWAIVEPQELLDWMLRQ